MSTEMTVRGGKHRVMVTDLNDDRAEFVVFEDGDVLLCVEKTMVMIDKTDFKVLLEAYLERTT